MHYLRNIEIKIKTKPVLSHNNNNFLLFLAVHQKESRKGFPEHSLVLVIENSPLYPLIAGFETHY